MRLLLRHSITAVTALSLVLFAGTLCLWLSARSRPVELGCYTNGRIGSAWRTTQYTIASSLGRIAIGCSDYTLDDAKAADGFGATFTAGRQFFFQHATTINFIDSRWHFLGLRRSYDARPVGQFTYTTSAVSVPAWILALLSGVLPTSRAAVAIARSICRRVRARAGRCRVCGYDLRATPERCPECGLIVSKGQSTSRLSTAPECGTAVTNRT